MIRLFGTWVARSMEVMRTRRHLSRLNDEALRDLGLTRADVAAECARPFWDWYAYDRHAHRRRFDAGRRSAARRLIGS